MCLTAKERMHGVHAELSDLPLGGHRCECHKRFELSVTEKERHALLGPFRANPTDDAGHAFAHSCQLRRRWSCDKMICDEEPGCALLDWEWLREREHSLRASTLAADSGCNRSRFFQSRVRSRLVDQKRLSMVFSRMQKTTPIPDEGEDPCPVITITGPSGLSWR